MGLLSNRLGIRALSVEDPAQPLIPPSALFESLGLGRSDAGVLVNVKQAERLSTAYACIKGISEDLASTSLEILQELPDDSMRPAKNHRLWPILHDEWNPNMSSMVGRSAIIASALAYGNGYAWIKRDGAARVVALIPLDSGRTAPVKVNGQLMYATTQTDTGEPKKIDPENMLHILGMSHDGITGVGPITNSMNAFGLGLAAEKFGAQFFGNGARSTGVLTHPGQLEDEAYENLKKSVREWATGESALRPLILEEGLKWEQISIKPNDAQFLETRKFQKEEIAGLFRFPMHLLGMLERATNNNIEHQGLDYVRYCLRPWALRLEHECNRKLLGGPYTCEHNFYDLQRGDFATQTAGFQTLRNIGVYHADNILKKLRENPIGKSKGGEILTVQGAMINLETLMDPGEAPDDPNLPSSADPGDDPADPAAKRRLLVSYRRLFQDAMARFLASKNPSENYAARIFQPLATSMTEAMLAFKFGNSTITPTEERIIDGVLPKGNTWWLNAPAQKLASELMNHIYDGLAKEIL